MNITPENAIAVQHSDWLQHPVTKQMLIILRKQHDMYVNTLSANAFKGEDIELRKSAIAINTINSIKSWTTDTAKFVELLDKSTTK